MEMSMDALLARLGYQAINVALRSGLSIASSLAVQHLSKLLKRVDDSPMRRELRSLQHTLKARMGLLLPIIDIIELKSGRGNVFLEAAMPLVKSLQTEIVILGQYMADATAAPCTVEGGPGSDVPDKRNDLATIIRKTKELLVRIEREIPLISVAVNASGECLSTSLPSTVSPSRLLQAAMFLNIGDGQFAVDPTRPVQIGPTFYMSLYMLFVSHTQTAVDESNRKAELAVKPTIAGEIPSTDGVDSAWSSPGGYRPMWKEVVHKCRVRLCRNPQDWVFDRALGYCPRSATPEASASDQPGDVALLDEETQSYSYHLEIVEDLDDGRVHEDLAGSHVAFDNIEAAGIRESVPVREALKIFYADTGRLLNLGTEEGENRPILLLKRQVGTRPSTKTVNADQPRPLDDGIESESESLEDQAEIDRQLRRESQPKQEQSALVPETWRLPQHLDQEWLAFEVFVDNKDVETDSDSETGTRSPPLLKAEPATRSSSLNASLVSQLRKMSLGSSPPPRHSSRPSLDKSEAVSTIVPTLVTPSPFGAVASSLSMLEMLLRLTNMQECYQSSYLAIPDHILTFFLEETSTTGLRGERRWQARREATRKVGFDPYTDTPTR